MPQPIEENCLAKLIKGKGRHTCGSVAHMSQTLDQKRFTISEVTCDGHWLMVPQRIMRPSTAADN